MRLVEGKASMRVRERESAFAPNAYTGGSTTIGFGSAP